MKIIKKLIALSLTSISVLAFSSIGASAEWKKDGKGWWYTEGNSYATGWRTIDGKLYYFDYNGYMAHDTTIDRKYIKPDGSASILTNDIVQSTVNAEPLNKSDFNIVDNNGNNVNLIDSWDNVAWANLAGYVGEANQDKDKTYRGIKLGASVNDVINKYGNSTVGYIGAFDYFHKFPNYEHNPATKVVTYSYYENDTKWGGIRNSYNLKFYFNDSNQLVLMVYVKNQNMNNPNSVYNK